jgi:hypothetical protein
LQEIPAYKRTNTLAVVLAIKDGLESNSTIGGQKAAWRKGGFVSRQTVRLQEEPSLPFSHRSVGHPLLIRFSEMPKSPNLWQDQNTSPSSCEELNGQMLSELFDGLQRRQQTTASIGYQEQATPDNGPPLLKVGR